MVIATAKTSSDNEQKSSQFKEPVARSCVGRSYNVLQSGKKKKAILGCKCLDRMTTEVIGARRIPITLSLPYYCNTETWPGTPPKQWRYLVTMFTTEVALWYCATFRFLPAKLKIHPRLLILPISCHGKQGNSDTSNTALSYTPSQNSATSGRC